MGNLLGAGGYLSVIEITETTGKWLPEADRTPEAIAAHWASIAIRRIVNTWPTPGRRRRICWQSRRFGLDKNWMGNSLNTVSNAVFEGRKP